MLKSTWPGGVEIDNWIYRAPRPVEVQVNQQLRRTVGVVNSYLPVGQAISNHVLTGVQQSASTATDSSVMQIVNRTASDTNTIIAADVHTSSLTHQLNEEPSVADQASVNDDILDDIEIDDSDSLAADNTVEVSAGSDNNIIATVDSNRATALSAGSAAALGSVRERNEDLSTGGL